MLNSFASTCTQKIRMQEGLWEPRSCYDTYFERFVNFCKLFSKVPAWTALAIRETSSRNACGSRNLISKTSDSNLANGLSNFIWLPMLMPPWWQRSHSSPGHKARRTNAIQGVTTLWKYVNAEPSDWLSCNCASSKCFAVRNAWSAAFSTRWESWQLTSSLLPAPLTSKPQGK